MMLKRSEEKDDHVHSTELFIGLLRREWHIGNISNLDFLKSKIEIIRMKYIKKNDCFVLYISLIVLCKIAKKKIAN